MLKSIIVHEMGKSVLIVSLFAGIMLFSCKSGNEKIDQKLADNTIVQQQDGTISLEVTRADVYHDVNEPESNTAEWSVVVSKSGRYDVWLSSATKDTTRLQYANAVMLSVSDNILEARPSVDRVVQNSSEVTYPYYKADSFLGSLYLKDAGTYNIQVVSDGIVPDNVEDETELISVSLTPSE